MAGRTHRGRRRDAELDRNGSIDRPGHAWSAGIAVDLGRSLDAGTAGPTNGPLTTVATHDSGAPDRCWARDYNTYTIPIEGRDEWLAAARRLA